MRHLAVLALVASTAAHAQTPADGVDHQLDRVAIAKLTSIAPNDTEFADLEPLREAIGDSRMVVLGEQSHGDGPVFLAKARMVRFLHQQMGFDVLCWESNMLGCLEMNERVADGEVPLAEAFDAVFPIWTLSAQVAPTLEYVRETHATDRPILQIGMDAQMTGPRTGAALKERVMRLIDSIGGLAPFDAVAGLDLFATIGGGMRPNEQTVKDAGMRLERLAGYIEPHLDELAEEHGRGEVELVYRTIDDAAWFCRMMSHQLSGRPLNADMDLINDRDRRMGDNLAWLLEEYLPDRKIIVWAATRHAVHRQKEIEFPAQPDLYANMDSMGETAFDRLGDDLYTIGFTAGRGKVANVFNPNGFEIGEPQAGSIEEALAGLDHPFLFADFRSLPDDHPWRESQWMRPLGYAWQTAVWPDQMDAVVYIDTMFPSTREELRPATYELRLAD